jgi:adenylate cyclase
MYGQLLPLQGGDPIPLLKPTLIVGRRERCDIVLNYPSISSQHAELEFRDGYWSVRDLHSVNGIQVNGKRAMQRIMRPGDTVAFARYAFEIAYVLDPNAPPPEERDPFELGLLEKAGISGNRPAPPPRPSATQSSRPIAESHERSSDPDAIQ